MTTTLFKGRSCSDLKTGSWGKDELFAYATREDVLDALGMTKEKVNKLKTRLALCNMLSSYEDSLPDPEGEKKKVIKKKVEEEPEVKEPLKKTTKKVTKITEEEPEKEVVLPKKVVKFPFKEWVKDIKEVYSKMHILNKNRSEKELTYLNLSASSIDAEDLKVTVSYASKNKLVLDTKPYMLAAKRADVINKIFKEASSELSGLKLKEEEKEVPKKVTKLKKAEEKEREQKHEEEVVLPKPVSGTTERLVPSALLGSEEWKTKLAEKIEKCLEEEEAKEKKNEEEKKD